MAERCYEIAAALEPGDWRWMYYRAVIDPNAAAAKRSSRVFAASSSGRRNSGPRGCAWERPSSRPAVTRCSRGMAAAERTARQGEAAASPRHVTEFRSRRTRPRTGAGGARSWRVRGRADDARSRHWPGRRIRVGAPLLAESYRVLGARRGGTCRWAGRHAARFAPYADPMIDELARESRNSMLLLRLASEAKLSINAEWSEYLTRRALEFDPTIPKPCRRSGGSSGR